MPREFEELAEKMSKWNWKLFFQTASNLGNQFNERTWRFLKAEVLALALEMCSRGEADYVDAPGYDLVVGDLRIELKSQERAFTRNLDTASIRMKNTMGENQRFDRTFDYLIVANSEPPYIAALTPWEEVYKGHRMTGDAVTSKIGKASLKFITSQEGEELASGFPPSDSLKETVRDAIREYLEEILRRLDGW